MDPHFSCLPFDRLTLRQLYDIMALRQAVFVVEQNCPYLDADSQDQAAYHLMGYDENGGLIAYARIFPKGTAYSVYAGIGRVVSAPQVRGRGVGKKLMEEILQQTRLLFGEVPLKMSAQCYLVRFYEGFGFQTTGEQYLEDGIPHIAMVSEE